MLKNKWTYIVFVLLLSGIVFYGLFWNKPHRKIENFETTQVNAVSIARLFEEDEQTANKKYLNKPLTVEGEVKDISYNDDGKQVILLQGETTLLGVQCTLIDSNEHVHVGDKVTISGFCSGYTLVVVLSQCKFLNQL
ncbi:OB-fold protein [Sphingobacterium sp. LRF_L2]|uniref:OB-fold protein n=1 Tax=Sphingobacterium sp. LRF_L2 TaxID=3369421 RepID=UPI003F61A892